MTFAIASLALGVTQGHRYSRLWRNEERTLRGSLLSPAETRTGVMPPPVSAS